MLISKIQDFNKDYGFGRRLTIFLLESGVDWDIEYIYNYILVRVNLFDGITIVEDEPGSQRNQILELLTLLRKDNLLKGVNIQLITTDKFTDIPNSVKLKFDTIINDVVYNKVIGKHFIRFGDKL